MSKTPLVLEGVLSHVGTAEYIGKEKKHKSIEFAIRFVAYTSKAGEDKYSEPTFSMFTWDGTKPQYDKIEKIKAVKLGEVIQVEFEVDGSRIPTKADPNKIWANNRLVCNNFMVMDGNNVPNGGKPKPTAADIKESHAAKISAEARTPDPDDLPF